MDHDTATSNHPTFTFKNPFTFIFTFSREGGGGISLAIFAIQRKIQQAKYLKNAKMTNGDL